MEEKDYLGFDYKVKVTDKDIAFLLDVTKPSDITAKIDDEGLNKISEFYNGKFVSLDFKEFGCRTFESVMALKSLTANSCFCSSVSLTPMIIIWNVIGRKRVSLLKSRLHMTFIHISLCRR